jgi:molybdenum-dependent DNA-binding transcriptional regulator ModE
MIRAAVKAKIGVGSVSKLNITKGRRWDHLELLERIGAKGSISSAASAMGMSYKAAWEAVEAINNLSEQPLVERKTGGQIGGVGRRSLSMVAGWWGRIGVGARASAQETITGDGRL